MSSRLLLLITVLLILGRLFEILSIFLWAFSCTVKLRLRSISDFVRGLSSSIFGKDGLVTMNLSLCIYSVYPGLPLFCISWSKKPGSSPIVSVSSYLSSFYSKDFLSESEFESESELEISLAFIVFIGVLSLISPLSSYSWSLHCFTVMTVIWRPRYKKFCLWFYLFQIPGVSLLYLFASFWVPIAAIWRSKKAPSDSLLVGSLFAAVNLSEFESPLESVSCTALSTAPFFIVVYLFPNA